MPPECQTVWIHIWPDKMSGLIWVQTVCIASIIRPALIYMPNCLHCELRYLVLLIMTEDNHCEDTIVSSAAAVQASQNIGPMFGLDQKLA